MKVYSLEYERWLRDPRISEAVDNCELSTLYQWLWESMNGQRSYQSFRVHDGDERGGSTQGED